jgi:Family of unknown function (DUF5677)
MSPRARKLVGDDAVAASVIADLGRVVREAEDFSSGDAEVMIAAAALGWMIRAARTAEGVVLLHRHDLGSEAAPLARSVMEHAMKLYWLVHRRESAVDTLTYDHQRYQALLKKSMDEGGWDLDGIGADLPSHEDLVRPEHWTEFRSFESVLTAIDRESLYAAYRLESAFSHATYLSGAAYWNYDRFDRGEPGYGWRPAAAATPLHATATHLAMCLDAATQVIESETIAEGIARAATRLGPDSPPATEAESLVD